MDERTQGRRQRGRWNTAFAALATVFFMVGGPAGMCLGQMYAKGLVWNPGGGTTPSNESVMFFVGASRSGGGHPWFEAAIGNLGCPNLGGCAGGDMTQGRTIAPNYTVGGAAVFNDLVYFFVSEYSGTAPGTGTPMYEIAYWAGTPNAWVSNCSPGSRMTVATGIVTNAPCPSSPCLTPINAAATVWNGELYVFSTPSVSAPNPVVFASADGQNWQQIVVPETPQLFTIVHDAATVSSAQVPSLSNVPGISDTVVMLIGSNWNGTGLPDTQAYVAWYDPGANVFYGPTALPMPSVPVSGFSLTSANAYFGTVSTLLYNTQISGCEIYEWNPPVPAVLHVMASTTNGSVERLAHWYLDPSSGAWVLEMAGQGGCSDQIPYQGCGPGNQYPPHCAVAVVPAYFASPAVSGCPGGQLCSDIYVNGNFYEGGFLPFSNLNESCWWGTSDYWHIDPNYYENLPPTQYESMTDSVSAAMRQLWQIIGVIAGPPPFDGNAFDAGLLNVSSVDFGYDSSQSNQQQGTWSTNFSFGETVAVGPPFFRTKVSVQASTGASVTQGSGTSYKVTMDEQMGTNTQTSSQFGQVGYAYMSGPIIQPLLYQAYWAKDNQTSLGYTQIAMSISGNQKMFYPFYLQNPGNVDATDPGTGAFGLMAGSMSFPLSSDILGWNTQPQWDYAPESYDPSSFTVLAGMENQLAQALQGGIDVTQSFTTSQTSFTTNDTSMQTSESVSVKLSIPIVPEATERPSRDGVSLTTEVDMSQGYEVQSTSSSEIDKSLTLSYFVSESSTIFVYPYFLQALKPDAPWVPKGYTGPLPWLLTWYAEGVQAEEGPGAQVSGGRVTAAAGQPAFGRAPLPRKAWGTISGFAPPNQKPRVGGMRTQRDSYAITGGKLAMKKGKDLVLPIAMTADTFDPQGEVSVTLNGVKILGSAKLGVWERKGQVWTYRSRQGTGAARVRFSLDFTAGSWDFCVERATLGWYTDPLNPVLTIVLNLNDLYLLSSRVRHESAYHWEADLSAVADSLWVSSVSVDKDFEGGGKVLLKGSLPDSLKGFGDFSVAMNGTQKDLTVTEVEGFTKKLFQRCPMAYRDATGSFTVDLGSGMWRCAIDTEAFPNPGPVKEKDGRTDLRLKIGGKEHFSQRVSPDFYRMDLRYGE